MYSGKFSRTKNAVFTNFTAALKIEIIIYNYAMIVQ